MLAVLVAAQRMPARAFAREPVLQASEAVLNASQSDGGDHSLLYHRALAQITELTSMTVFAPADTHPLDEAGFREASRALLAPQPDAPIERIYFETMPLSWMGAAYQRALSLRPDPSGDGLAADRAHRKSRGVYFTPASLVTYIVEGVLTPMLESSASRALRVLDPAMGGGDFLTQTVDFLCDSEVVGDRDAATGLREKIAAECVFGVDVDPLSVDIARFSVWNASCYADGVPDAINRHLICADALGPRRAEEPSLDWPRAFPEVFSGDRPGFDAVIGNPPYIASKNGLGPRKPGAGRGQSDYYLMFLSTALENGRVAPGGMLSMVLPDPMLVRGNAACIRRALVNDWSIVSILHISDVFEDACVANVVPICRNAPSTSPTFAAARIEKAADRRSFSLRPRKTVMEIAHPVRRDVVRAQDRAEILYLLEQGAFGHIIRQIHGESASLARYIPPFVPLSKLNVEAIYRGEEVGKSAISLDAGDLPMLLGGQSIQPYEVIWEGRWIRRSQVRKPIERYAATKILIQKSSPRLIAALDSVSRRRPGFVFPQSVYAVELKENGMHPLYLLCLLNSEVLNEYIWRTATAYKLLQPQLELEDIRALPIRRVNFTTPPAERELHLAHAIGLFEDESLRTTGERPFPLLTDLVVSCLTQSPERSDVVHDLLVHLGRLTVDLTRAGREAPDTETTRRLESARGAVENVVWRLYTTQPAQMELPW